MKSFYLILNYSISIIFNYSLIVVSSSNDIYNVTYAHEFDSYDYPKQILTYHIRRDHYTNEIVSRGRLERIGGLEHKNAPISLSLFKKELQCAIHEPTLNGRRGIIDVLQMIRPTKEILELMCAWIESRCKPWSVCRDVIKQFKNSTPSDLNLMKRDMIMVLAHVNLVRIMKNKVYIDWPWGSKRFADERFPYYSMVDMMFRVLDHLNDMRDSVFLLGAEQPFLPLNFPFPAFSNSPSMLTGDIPWPWFESTETEWRSYQYILKHHPDILLMLKNNSDSSAYSEQIIDRLPWEKRLSKAVYYGEMISVRQIVFDQAILHPDLIEAKWKCSACQVDPWNPLSDEMPVRYNKKINNNISNNSSKTDLVSRTGFIETLWPIYLTDSKPYYPGNFKYVVVLVGIDGKASSGRLAYLLAHSGAVVLLQDSIFEYHFSSHLKPWIHYVPLTSTGADIIDKIKWLNDHDFLARKIAKNAENFGKSYLRLEDYYCYVATALDTIANLEADSDILNPYEPYVAKYN